MKALVLCVLAAAPLLARAGDPVVLVGPEETTKADLDKCAAALARRFAAVGLKGLKAATVEKDGKRSVEVTSKDEIPAETRLKIVELSGLAGQKPVLKFQYVLTADDKAQGFDYTKVKDVKTEKAPRGTTWTDGLDKDLKNTRTPTGGGLVVLVRDNPYVNWSELSATDKGSAEWTITLSAAATKVLFNQASGAQPGARAPFCYTRISFDTFTVDFEVKVILMKDKAVLKEATFALPVNLAEKLEAIVRNPMPTALKAAGK